VKSLYKNTNDFDPKKRQDEYYFFKNAMSRLTLVGKHLFFHGVYFYLRWMGGARTDGGHSVTGPILKK